jgi:predicted RNA-binding protein with RPS1 domain
MSSTEEKKADNKERVPKGDFSVFAVGQQYDGKVMTAKQFGIFVDISKGYNVLLPKGKLSVGAYNKLKEFADSKNKESIKIELIGVDAGNQTLSGKYIDPNFKERERKVVDLTLVKVDQKVNGTVVSTHDFGAFISLDELGFDGLLPASKMRGVSLTKGSKVQVKIDQIDKEKNKLVLALDGAASAPMAGISPQRWIQGTVVSITNFGLFVRPAGMDFQGLVHNSRIPRDLISALKERETASRASNKTDVEALFSVGDVVKVRVNGVNAGKTELSMLKFTVNDDEEDDYVVEGREAEDEENPQTFEADEDGSDSYDAQDTLLWWRGSPYVKSKGGNAAVDEEAEVVMENTAVVEGTWRRMFELDMREDQADFSTKVKEADLKELEEEIGELSGLDENLIEPELSAASIISSGQKLVNYVSLAGLPAAWKSEMGFLKGSAEGETSKVATLRQGKTLEQSEFEALLREVEVELDEAAKRGGRADAAAAVAASAAAEPEPAAPTEGA